MRTLHLFEMTPRQTGRRRRGDTRHPDETAGQKAHQSHLVAPLSSFGTFAPMLAKAVNAKSSGTPPRNAATLVRRRTGNTNSTQQMGFASHAGTPQNRPKNPSRKASSPYIGWSAGCWLHCNAGMPQAITKSSGRNIKVARNP